MITRSLPEESAVGTAVTHRAVWAGLVVVRWVALAWLIVVLVINRGDLLRPWLASALALAAGAVSVGASRSLRAGRDPSPSAIGVELAVGLALVVCDGWAYGEGHVFTSQASLGSTWPLAGVVAAGLLWGSQLGIVAGFSVGLARVGAAYANEIRSFSSDRVTSIGSTAVLWALAGGVAGWIGMLLRRAEREIARSHAREELGRTLHDGVLQTLALVERKGDPLLAAAAQRTEQRLRAYLAGSQSEETTIDQAIREAVSDAAALYPELAVRVVVAPDVGVLDKARTAALAAATRECVINAGKHAGACRVNVYVEPDENDRGVVVVVRDDGPGFDSTRVGAGYGLRHSVVDRVQEVGGAADVMTELGRGTEVTLRV